MIIDTTPDYYVEKKWNKNILDNLNPYLYQNNIDVIIRDHKECEFPKGKFISIVTSTEGHQYFPKESLNPNCLGVFMHYPPSKLNSDVYDVNCLDLSENVYAIPLGYHKDFDRNFSDIFNVMEKPIDIMFWGQYDPYRRSAFHYHYDHRCPCIVWSMGVKV